jgi:acyl-CoA synthetase (AMP-forming)/AMP-acid ligase II/3-oxoacyl-(acyl-carrier-protein) synthase/acyl carrier protein
MTQPLTLIEILERRARSEPDALTFDDRPLAQLRADAIRLAIALRERGLERRPVLVAAPAGPDYVTCLLGCMYAGAIMVPAYPPGSNRLARANQRIASILGDADVACALVTKTPCDVDHLPIEALQLDALIAEVSAPAEVRWSVDPDAVCLLQYTSGSTATPKGIAVSLRQLTANVVAIRDATHLTPSDVFVTWLPPYHDMGLLGGIFCPLYMGIPAYVLSPDAFIRSPLRWLQAITARQATVTMAPNFAFDLCVRRIPEARRIGLDLSSLRLVYNGAEPIHAGTLDAFAAAFAPFGFERRAFYPCYGLAEATLFVAGGDPNAEPVIAEVDALELEHNRVRAAQSDARTTRLVGCGQAGGSTRLRIVDPEQRRELSDSQVGEIWVSGESIATGYWNRPDETREVFGAELADTGEGPFLRTGDLGFRLAGELFVAGRLKDLIVIRGQNHYPHDIERTIQAHHPALASVLGAAFSVRVEGEERPVVVHELDTRLHRDVPNLIPELIALVSEMHGLSLQACVIVKRGSLARTASGKVQRQRMRRAFLEDALEVIARWDASDPRPVGETTDIEAEGHRESRLTRPQPRAATHPRSEIIEFLRGKIAQLTRLPIAEIDDHTPLARYGIDSLNAAELAHTLEEFLGTEVPPTLSYDRPTIAAIAAALSEPQTAPVSTPERNVASRSPAEPNEAIAIVGMSCRFPGAPTLERFWDLLARGVDAVSDVPLDRTQVRASGARSGGFVEGIDRFDAAFFGISAREAARMDPQQRMFLELSWAALEDAGIAPSSLRETDTGVFAGVCTNDYALLHAGQLSLIDADYGAGHAQSVVANRVSYTLDLHGPSMTVDTACSSALVALHLASESLRRGECDVAIVGGVNAVLAAEPGVFFAKARALSKDGRCKTFDAGADGFVRSEGCGVLVLKRQSDALSAHDRIYALVRGSAVNHDGCSNGLMAPSGPAQERLLRSAWRAARVTPDQLDYIEAHGVGTPLADAIELAALGSVLASNHREWPCHVGSVKTNIGHLEAASGIAGVIKTALALTHEQIPAHLHLRTVSAQVDFARLELAIPTLPVAWPRGTHPRIAGVSAFGFGGTNAHVVLGESPVRKPPKSGIARSGHLLALSAKDPTALRQLAALLSSRVEDAKLRSLCYSMNAGRDHFAYRAGLVAMDATSLRAELRQLETGLHLPSRKREPRVAFTFCPQPAAAGAARGLAREEPMFRRALARGAEAAAGVLDADLFDALITEPAGGAAAEPTPFPHTSTVLLHYACFSLLDHWGIIPALAAGSGVGEYSAACAAGVLDWHEALSLVARRELLLGSLVPGGRVRQTLHQFKAALRAPAYRAPSLPLIAAGLRRLLAPEETLDAAYWLEHMYAQPCDEPNLVALGMFEPELEVEFSPATADPYQMLQTVARLYEQGCDFDFQAFYEADAGEKLSLPTYPFQRQRHWLEIPKPEPVAAIPQSQHPFLVRTRTAESGSR